MGKAIYFDWEPTLMEWLQSHIGSFGTSLMSFFSAFGEETIMIAFMCILYFIIDKEAAKFAARRFMIAGCFYAGIKNIVCRRRPYMVHGNVKCLKPVDKSADLMDVIAQGYSFPSGHSANAVTAYGTIGRQYNNKAVRVFAIVIPLLVGVSRFCLGVHYPTDVLAGWLLGLVIIFVIPWFVGKFEKRWIPYLIILLVMLPGWFYCKSNDFYTGYGMTVGFFIGDLFEEKYVRFQNTRVWWKVILRVIGGAAVYFGLNMILKMPFSSEFQASGTCAAYLVRALRYAIILFVDIAV